MRQQPAYPPMPRLPRYAIAEVPQLVTHRGNNRGEVFFGEGDYAFYREALGALAARCGLAIHAYVLLPGEVRFVATPRAPDSLARAMQALSRRHARRTNLEHGRSGALWEGRYRAAPLQAERWLLPAARFIEQAPVQEGVARRIDEWRWSSYRANAQGAADPLLTPHAEWRRLGRSNQDRRTAWRALLKLRPGQEELEAIQAALAGGWVLGDTGFRDEVARLSGRRPAPLPRGRPPKRPRPRLPLDQVVPEPAAPPKRRRKRG